MAPVLVGLLAFLAAVAGCSEPAPPPGPPRIQTVDVIQRDQPIVLELVGETRGSADIPVRARVEGVIQGMHFSEGREVEEGDPLYTIDPSPFESRVIEAQAYLAEARTMLAKAKADLDRIQPLAEMGAVSRTMLDGATAQRDAARAALQAAAARLKLAKIERGYTKIAAPIDGRIGISEARVGEFVGREPNPVVLNFVSRTDPIRVRFSIDERRYLVLARHIFRTRDKDGGESAEGPGIELILADGSVHEHRGRTVATDAAIDPRTGTFTLEADFPNPDGLVLAGQFARLRAVAETRRNALLVPQRAVSELQGRFRVYVVADDGKVELRDVELGRKIERLQLVDSGLKAGERIALDVMRLRAGMTVEPVMVELDESGAVVRPPEADEAATEAAGA
ncbi:MAG: efflux RND transporter periplasmic adaptor subunit [Deltaproteobacteria bacterium]|nr:efflux RND transporter periplasmic adaptor subunit [Deltaproteobacteria bacterium]MBW2361714.1 efflux RND transporter periplasmic adaptor subunit [Deltaproteobacteria bacterium]